MMENEKKNKNQKSFMRNPYAIVTLVVLVVYLIVLLFPMFWGFWTAAKSNTDYLDNQLGFPKKWQFVNFWDAFTNYSVPVFKGGKSTIYYAEMLLLFSILYAGGSALATTITCCIVAYVTARYNFKFSKVVYGIVLVTMTLPIVGALPSEIQMVKNLGLYDTIWGMWILKANFLGMYYLVFFATFKGLPKDYDEAARLDGAGNFMIMMRIALPLVKNIFMTVLLIKFIEYWNDYSINVTYLPSYPTLAYGLYEFANSTRYSTPERLAACFILIIPIVIVFSYTHDKMMSNLSVGGGKE